MAYIITSTLKNISAINMTCKDPNGIILDINYFNTLFGTTDCVITEVPDDQVYIPQGS